MARGGVVICSDQVACKDISRNDFTLEYSFSERWLEKYTDSATVMNNLIYIFDFVDSAGMMTMPAHAHEESGLLAAIGIHVQGEYRMGIGSQMKESLSLLEVMAYNDFLKRHATRLEDALEWVYREYFQLNMKLRDSAFLCQPRAQLGLISASVSALR